MSSFEERTAERFAAIAFEEPPQLMDHERRPAPGRKMVRVPLNSLLEDRMPDELRAIKPPITQEWRELSQTLRDSVYSFSDNLQSYLIGMAVCCPFLLCTAPVLYTKLKLRAHAVPGQLSAKCRELTARRVGKGAAHGVQFEASPDLDPHWGKVRVAGFAGRQYNCVDITFPDEEALLTMSSTPRGGETQSPVVTGSDMSVGGESNKRPVKLKLHLKGSVQK